MKDNKYEVIVANELGFVTVCEKNSFLALLCIIFIYYYYYYLIFKEWRSKTCDGPFERWIVRSSVYFEGFIYTDEKWFFFIIIIIIQLDNICNYFFMLLDVNTRRDISKTYLEMDILSSAKRLFENAKKGDEKIIVYKYWNYFFVY